MQCDMCGKLAPLAVAEIEGIELNVCSNCSGFGKVIRRLSSHPLKGHSESKRNMEMKKASDDEEIKEMIVDDYAELIKRKRESMNLTQEQFAKKINVRESLLQNIECGKFVPQIDLAKRLEKELNLKLVEEYKEAPIIQERKSSGPLTIGDIIKKKFELSK